MHKKLKFDEVATMTNVNVLVIKRIGQGFHL